MVYVCMRLSMELQCESVEIFQLKVEIFVSR